MAAKAFYSGVDYWRATAQDHAPMAEWRAILLPEWLREERLGRKPNKRWLMSYYGRMTEHSFLGENEAGCMIQLSGGFAWERWLSAARTASRASRIDIQVTYPVDIEPGVFIRKEYERACAAPKQRGKQPELMIFDTPRGAKMLTTGSRSSTMYGRMYDKYRESRMEEYRGCVRWEVEVKGEQAHLLGEFMKGEKWDSGVARTQVHGFWAQRGMAPSWDTYHVQEAPVPIKRSKTDETKIAWLATQVRPTIEHLFQHQESWRAMRAILPEAVSDSTVSAIITMLENEVDG